MATNSYYTSKPVAILTVTIGLLALSSSACLTGGEEAGFPAENGGPGDNNANNQSNNANNQGNNQSNNANNAGSNNANQGNNQNSTTGNNNNNNNNTTGNNQNNTNNNTNTNNAGCVDTCEADALRCDGEDAIEVCALGEDGCLEWTIETNCTEGLACEADPTPTCVPTCDVACDVGATRCGEDITTIETCTDTGDACLAWLADACPTQQACDGDDPMCVCDDACANGESRCLDGQRIEGCAQDASGCWGYVEQEPCGGQQRCLAPAGIDAACTCEDACALDTCDSDGALVACETDSDGCRVEAEPVACGANQRCVGTDGADAACVCDDTCDSDGETRCADDATLETCATDADGCLTFSTTESCPDLHLCDAGAANIPAACVCANPCDAVGLVCQDDVSVTCALDDVSGCYTIAASEDCAPGVCDAGVCCAQGERVCSGADSCVDTMTDTEHCGSCGASCGTGQTCMDGECFCPVSRLTPTQFHTGFVPTQTLSMDMGCVVDSRNLNPSAIIIHGEQSGRINALVTRSGSNRINLDELDPLPFPGERIAITVRGDLLSDAVAVEPFSWQFHAATTPSDGTLAQAPPRQVIAGANGAVLADFDGDRMLDVAVAAANDQPDRILLNSATGFFPPTSQMLAPERDSRDVVAADFDGDGLLDLLFADPLLSDRLFAGDGRGLFNATGANYGDFQSHSVAAFDLNLDGHPDAIISGRPYINDARGNLIVAESPRFEEIFYGAAIGDLDGDGDPDVVSVGGGVRVWFNTGDGTFTEGPTLSTDFAFDIEIGDLDLDGDLDLIVPFRERNAQIFTNDGSGRFASSTTFATDQLAGAEVADFNGDRNLDIIFFAVNGEPSQLFYNTGDGVRFNRFSEDLPISRQSDVGDVDFDGDVDVLSVDGGTVRVWLNDE